jgi:hypothetical protein
VIFDLLDIDLVHGWLVETEDAEMYSLISPLAYNSLMEKLVPYSQLVSSEKQAIITSSTTITAPKPQQPQDEGVITTTSSTEKTEPPPAFQRNNSTLLPASFQAKPAETKEEVKEKLPEPSATQPTSNLKKEDQEQILREGQLIEKFISKTASQLTFAGLCELHQHLRDNQLCVFFRNNHFSTLFKYKGDLYNLITDAGYSHEPIVWEKLDQVSYISKS